MTARPQLTVAILALNEERNLAELLPQLTWAEEVVVVDAGLRDASATVARRHGARVVYRRFDNFSAQRNHALDCAQGDWVLMLDADERPTIRLAEEVRQRIRGTSCSAYRVPIRSNIFGRAMRFSGTQDDQPIRLVRRDLARWHGPVHEVCEARGRVGRLRNRLLHTTLPSAEAFLEKMHRYTRLEATARVARQQAPRWGESCFAPSREFFRRFVWKLGVLDGPEGWLFCALSGLSAWVLAREHARQWHAQHGQNIAAREVTAQLIPCGGTA